jgi:hypothetical protein
MSIRPSLTWMYLFGRDVSFTCDNGPEWFRGMVEGARSSGESSVRVAWQKSLGSLGDLSGQDGLAGVNCRGWSDGALRSAGFGNIARFAVVPSIEKARWFVPLESPALSAAGLSVHTPARTSSLLKHYAIRLATRTRLPLWYRDTVCIAQRKTPPLHQLLGQLFPGIKLHLAMTSGAPEPAKNRKTSVAVLDEKGHRRAFLKVAGSPLSRRLLQHEAMVLKEIENAEGDARRTPRLLFAGEVEGRFVTIQTPLAGKPVLGSLTDTHRDFLRSLHLPVRKVASETSVVSSLASRILALEPERPELLAMLEQIMPVLEGMTVPSTIVHGDFVPWNLRRRDGEISAFDWEYAQIDGLPLMDETHFMIQDRFELNHGTPQEAYEDLTHFAAGRPMGYSIGQVRAIQLVYLIDHLTRLFGEKYDENEEMVHWYGRLLACYPVAMAEAVCA